MGTFFKGKEDSGRELVQKQAPHHGFFATAGLMILAFFLAVLTWIGKPLFTWLFTFQGITKEEMRVKVCLIVLIFGGISFAIYKIPFVRDFVSLSAVHTVNLEQKSSGRIFFPDTSFFVEEPSRRTLHFKEKEGLSYITYSGYKNDLVQSLPKQSCQLVNRSEKIFLATTSTTLQAEGFVDEVSFKITEAFHEAPLSRRGREYIFHPRLLITSYEERRALTITYPTTTTWKDFESAIHLKKAWTYKEDGAFPFETKARTNEYAVICAL